MACSPSAHWSMAMSAETFWEGTLDTNALQAHLESRAHVKVILGAQACSRGDATLRRRPAHQSHHPYMPAGDAQVRRAFTR